MLYKKKFAWRAVKHNEDYVQRTKKYDIYVDLLLIN